MPEHPRPSLYSEQQDRQDTPFFERQGGDTKDTVMENRPYCLNCNFLLFGWGWPDAWCPSLLHIHMHVIEIQLQKVACTLNRSSIIDAIFRDLLMRGFHLESKFSHATYMQSARSWVQRCHKVPLISTRTCCLTMPTVAFKEKMQSGSELLRQSFPWSKDAVKTFKIHQTNNKII